MKRTSYPFNYPSHGESDVWPLTLPLPQVESWEQWPNIEKYMRDMEGNPTFEEMIEPVEFLNQVKAEYWKNIAPRLSKLWEAEIMEVTEAEVVRNAIDMLSKPSYFSSYQRWAGLYKTFAMARFLTEEAAYASNYGRGVLLYNEPAIFSDLVMGKYIEALLALPDPERLLNFDVSAHHEIIEWGEDIVVLTEQEALDRVSANIRETVSTFSPDWLSQMTGFPRVIFTAIQNDVGYENPLGQSAIIALIEGSCGFDEFVDASIDDDGMGQFINAYDGETFEYDIFGNHYVVFRTGEV